MEGRTVWCVLRGLAVRPSCIGMLAFNCQGSWQVCCVVQAPSLPVKICTIRLVLAHLLLFLYQ